MYFKVATKWVVLHIRKHWGKRTTFSSYREGLVSYRVKGKRTNNRCEGMSLRKADKHPSAVLKKPLLLKWVCKCEYDWIYLTLCLLPSDTSSLLYVVPFVRTKEAPPPIALLFRVSISYICLVFGMWFFCYNCICLRCFVFHRTPIIMIPRLWLKREVARYNIKIGIKEKSTTKL